MPHTDLPACCSGYLNLLSQLTKVGTYDEAVFKGKCSA